MRNAHSWNPSKPRDAHLMPGGPKRILALDGGGIRGLLTCGILRHIEDTLRARQPVDKQADFVLADYYDFICGTSTGSIIAAWLALGKPVAALQNLYMEMGSNIFANSRRFGQVLVAKFDGDKLNTELEKHLGDLPLSTDALVTGLGVTAKRMDTGSAWVLTNNPNARYWSGSETDHPNADYLLRHVVRASAAAPAYFDHVPVEIERGNPPGAFMDGAVAGLNNPAMAFWLYTTVPGYGLAWETGPDKLLITSVGTGEFRTRFSAKMLRRMPAIKQAVFSLAGSIQDVGKQELLAMQALSRPVAPYPINSEVDSLASDDELANGVAAGYCVSGRPVFSFQRYDAVLDPDRLASVGVVQESGAPLGPGMIRNLKKMDCVNMRNLDRLKEIGEKTGAARVATAHFPYAFDTPGMKTARPAL